MLYRFRKLILFGLILFLVAGCDKDKQITLKQDELPTNVQEKAQLSPEMELTQEEENPALAEPSIVDTPETARDQIIRPDELPYPMTTTNIQHWKELVTRAIDDPDLLQSLLPDTKERAIETVMYLSNCVRPGVQSLFETAMWRKLAEIYPNDPEVLFNHSISLLKEQNDAQNVTIISPFRKTHSLTEAYIAIGEYEKAITNHEEQWERIDAMITAGMNNRFMYTGILPRGAVHHLIRATKAHKKKE